MKKNKSQLRNPLLLLCIGVALSPAFSQNERPDNVILLGEVLQSATWYDDLGTFSGHCLLRVDSVYRDGELVYEGQHLSLQVERSFSGDLPGQEAFQSDWLNLRGERVFLFADHLKGILRWPTDILMIRSGELPVDPHPTSSVQHLNMQHILYGPPASTYSNDCPPCAAFAQGKDARVLKLFKKEIKKQIRKKKSRTTGLQVYPCVSWVLTPEAVELSLPAFTSVIVVLDNGARRKELYYALQLGRGSRFFGLLKANTGVQKLIDIGFHDSLVNSWLHSQNFVLHYSLRDFDTLAYPTMPVPDEWLLLRDKYERPDHHFYNMHPTQQYLWETSLTALESNEAVFNLCLLTGHRNAQVQINALQALERMKDLRAVAYLQAVLKFEAEFDWELLNETERNERVEFRRQLLHTLATLLGTTAELTPKELIDQSVLEEYRVFFASHLMGSALKSF